MQRARFLLLAALLALLPFGARAQSGPNWALHFVPSPAQWQAEWQSKQDYNPTLTLYTGLTGTGPLQISNGIPVVGSLTQEFDTQFGVVQGTLAVRGPASWVSLLPGPNGTCLTSFGSASVPGWGSCGGGGGGSGTVTSVGLSMPGIFTVSGSPVATAGVLTAGLASENANTVWAGPVTGTASPPTFRALIGADLPLPGATTPGGYISKTAVSHQWLNSATTSGTFTSTQPACADISNATAACTTAIGTSGATLPLLNANNTFSGITTLGRVRTAERTVTVAGAVTVSATADFFICVNKGTGQATTVNLPASPVAGDTYIIKDCKGDAATNNITITPAAGNIDGAATYVMSTNYQAQGVTYNGSSWSLN